VSGTAAGSFDDLAEAYDRFRLGYADDVYEALVEYGVPPRARLLDLGCGTGLVAKEMARRGAVVTGVDLSEAMIARARIRVPEASFEVGRAEELSFADASFDAATSAQTFHWLDQPRALAELARVVRPGGIVAVWWKGLMRGDGMRAIREEVAREVGLDPPADLLAAEFDAFDRSSLVDRRLRVIPWRVTVSVEEFLGYERSRARSRDAYGPLLGDYLKLLERRLMDGSRDVSLAYTHLVYLGRVPEARA
jgi:SAM-dependent methyltransferase